MNRIFCVANTGFGFFWQRRKLLIALLALVLVLLVWFLFPKQPQNTVDPPIASNGMKNRTHSINTNTKLLNVSIPTHGVETPEAVIAQPVSPLPTIIKNKLEIAFKNRETERLIVLQNDLLQDGEIITLLIPRPNRVEVRKMLISALDASGADLSDKSLAIYEKSIAKELGDYTNFSASTPNHPLWGDEFVPKYRIISISFSETLSELDVRYVDTMEDPEKFWDPQNKKIVALGNTANGTYSPSAALNRYGHLFHISGKGKLISPPGSAASLSVNGKR